MDFDKRSLISPRKFHDGDSPGFKDVEPDPPRLFRGFKWVLVTAEDADKTEATTKEYMEIFKLR